MSTPLITVPPIQIPTSTPSPQTPTSGLAVPPAIADADDQTYTPIGSNFTGLVADTLGNALTDQDGFDDLFDPTADAYPGPDIVAQGLDPLLEQFASDTATIGSDPDPSFEGDLTTALQQAANVTGAVSEVGINVQPGITDPFPDPGTITAGSTPPGFISTSSDTAVREVNDTFVAITPDGNISWYVNPSEPDPISVYAATDGGPWTLYAQSRQGNDNPAWIVPGHFFAFQWSNPNGVIAQAYLDLRGEQPQTQAIVPPSSAAAAQQQATATGVSADQVAPGLQPSAVNATVPAPAGSAPSSIPPVPAGLVPSGSFTLQVGVPAAGQGTIVWTSQNASNVGMYYSQDGAPAVEMGQGNSGSAVVALPAAGHVTVYTLQTAVAGSAPTVLDSQTLDYTALDENSQPVNQQPAPTPAPAPATTAPLPTGQATFSTPAGMITGTAADAVAAVGTPAGITWTPSVTNTASGPVTILVPVDANGQNVSGVYGTIVPTAPAS